eukprot:3937370-Rhodomonas_salina.1
MSVEESLVTPPDSGTESGNGGRLCNGRFSKAHANLSTLLHRMSVSVDERSNTEHSEKIMALLGSLRAESAHCGEIAAYIEKSVLIALRSKLYRLTTAECATFTQTLSGTTDGASGPTCDPENEWDITVKRVRVYDERNPEARSVHGWRLARDSTAADGAVYVLACDAAELGADMHTGDGVHVRVDVSGESTLRVEDCPEENV